MPYQDSWAVCTQCGRRFVFRVEDQRRQSRRGEPITPPQLCPSCREGTKQQGEAEWPKETEVVSTAQLVGSRGSEPASGFYEGTVKWFNGEKGYGFISQRSDEDDIFFHKTGISTGGGGEMQEGAAVRYRIEHTEKGPQAVDIERLGTPGE